MTVKAIHLEMAIDLSTETFIVASDHFTSRSGIPANTYTDYGSNSIGIMKHIKTLLDTDNARQAISSHN